MPLYEFECRECGKRFEWLVLKEDAVVSCPECGSRDLSRLLSVPSSLTGRSARAVPRTAADTCCGHAPGEAGCAGPGSCCGRSFS